MEHLDILWYWVLRGRWNHGNVKETRKFFMRHYVVWKTVTNVSAETVACILNIEGKSYSMEPRVSIVVEDLIFNDTTKKFLLLCPKNGGTKFHRNIYKYVSTNNIKSYSIKAQPPDSQQWERQISNENFSKTAIIEREIQKTRKGDTELKYISMS
jgi:hypothetical protein